MKLEILPSAFVVALLLLAAGHSACTHGDTADTSELPPRLDEPLISIDDLAARLGEPRLVLIDARPTGEFVAGHIPGAVSASFSEAESTSHGEPVSYGGGVDFFVDNDNPLPFQDGSREQIEAAVRAMGISDDSEVVVYDAGGHFHASRFAYTLEKHGFRRLSVLDGGLRAWTNAGGRPPPRSRRSLPATSRRARGTPASSPPPTTSWQPA